jgi:hypothetical protein
LEDDNIENENMEICPIIIEKWQRKCRTKYKKQFATKVLFKYRIGNEIRYWIVYNKNLNGVVTSSDGFD